MAPKLPGLSLSKSQFAPYLDEHDDEDEGFGGRKSGGMGGLGGLGGLGGKSEGFKTGGGLGGLGGLGGKSGLGGFGGLGSSSSKQEGFSGGGLGGLAKPAAAAGRGRGRGSKQTEINFGMAGLTLRPPASSQPPAPSSAGHDKVANEQIKVLQELTKVVDGLADRTIEGFKSIAEKLNNQQKVAEEEQPEASVKHSVGLIIENISEQLKSKPDSAYIIVPGHEYVANVDFEAIKELIGSKKLTIVGDITTLTLALAESPAADCDDDEVDEDDDDDEE